MKSPQKLPLPFLILILAGVVSLFSAVKDRGTNANLGANASKIDSSQVEMLEQERSAELFLRVMLWFTDLNARTPAIPRPAPAVAPERMAETKSTRAASPWHVELCAYHTVQNLLGGHRLARNLNN